MAITQQDFDASQAGVGQLISAVSKRKQDARDLAEAERLKKQYGTETSVQVGQASIGARDPLQALLRLRELKKPSLTPGQEAADKDFGKDYSDYVAQGGSAGVQKNLNQLEFAKQGLKDTDVIDRAAGVLPKSLRDLITPKAAAREDAIKNSIQATLRQTLGTQFTEKEGQALMDRAYNPRMSPEENMRRVDLIIGELKSQAGQKERSAKQFERTGSLVGLDAVTPGLGQPAAQVAPIKQYSPSRNQTRISTDGGATWKVVDGKQ